MSALPNVINFSQDYAGTDIRGLLLKYYTGSLVNAARQQPYLFNSSIPFADIRDIGDGSSWQYGLNAEAPAPERLVSGERLLGQKYAVDEITATCEREEALVAHAAIGTQQKLESQFDVMPNLASEHYRKIANELDARIFRTLVLNARTTSRTKQGLNVHNGGNIVSRTGSSVSNAYAASPVGAQNVRADMRSMFQKFIEDKLDPKTFFFIPHYDVMHALKYDTGYVWGTPSNTATGIGSSLFSRDYTTVNDLNKAVIAEVDGFKVLPPVLPSSLGGPLPDQDFTASNSESSKFRGVFTPGSGIGTPAGIFIGGGMAGHAPVSMLVRRPLTPFVSNVMQDLEDVIYVGLKAEIGINKLHPWTCGILEVRSS